MFLAGLFPPASKTAVLLLRGQGLLEPLPALKRPDFLKVIVLAESRRSLGELYPRQFRLCVDVNIRSNRAGMIECADTDEPDWPAATIGAPQGNLALWTAINVVRTKTARHGNGLQFSAQDFYRRGFDDGIQDEGTACVPLAIAAVAAVHSNWLVYKLIAHLTAGATACELFWRPLVGLFHAVSCNIDFPFLNPDF